MKPSTTSTDLLNPEKNNLTKIAAADIASVKAHAINRETQDLLKRVGKSNSRALRWFIFSWTILLAVGVGGIYQQNHIARQNKQHIDCIIKLFVTPLPKGAQHKTIIDPSATCGITFTN